VVAINKMDLVDFSKEVYTKIVADYASVAAQLGLNDITYVPISALQGDNIVDASTKMDWYVGKPLLQLLEEVSIDDDINVTDPRFQVQFVLRPQTDELHDYRGYAGRVISGVYRKGDAVTILPAGLQTSISKLEIAGEEVSEIFAPQSATILLADDIDISRGDSIVNSQNLPITSNEISVLLCWMDDKPLQSGGKYYIQHNSQLQRAMVKEIEYRIDVNTLEHQPVEGQVKLNEVVKAKLKTSSQLVFDSYEKLRANGSAILIDETSNSTVAAVLFV